MKPEAVYFIDLEEKIYGKPTITLRGKNKEILHTIHPKPAKAEDAFNEIVRKWQEEINK